MTWWKFDFVGVCYAFSNQTDSSSRLFSQISFATPRLKPNFGRALARRDSTELEILFPNRLRVKVAVANFVERDCVTADLVPDHRERKDLACLAVTGLWSKEMLVTIPAISCRVFDDVISKRNVDIHGRPTANEDCQNGLLIHRVNRNRSRAWEQ